MSEPVVPDLLAPGLDLVFCGTAPSRVSARQRAYYANPGNRFWPTLHEVGLTPRRFAPGDYPALLGHGIGLTDLNKTEFGNDDELHPEGFDLAGLRAKLAHFRPAACAFTSKTAAALFLGCGTGELACGRAAGDDDGTALFVLPSTSGQARRFFAIGPWREVAVFVAARRQRR